MVDIDSLEGKTIGKQYALRKLVGSGGMGAVYRGVQLNLQRDVAIKVLYNRLSNDAEYLERFNREALIAASLEHPHIVPVYDYGTEDEINYVVMRLLTGGSLEERFGHNRTVQRPLPSVREMLDVLRQLAGALDYAHSQGVVHRDIKDSNVMFDRHGSAFIVDFGIARLTEVTSKLTGTGMTLGTPSYMSPEQWRGETAHPASDQYSMGVMAFALLTGELPFDAPNPHALMYKHLSEIPLDPASIRPELGNSVNAVFQRVLAKDFNDRYDTVTTFVDALEATLPSPDDASTLHQHTGFFTTEIPAAERAQPTPSAQRERAPAGPAIGAVPDGPTVTPLPAAQEGDISAPYPGPTRRNQNGRNGTIMTAVVVTVAVLIFGGVMLFAYIQSRQSPPAGLFVAWGMIQAETATPTEPPVTNTPTEDPTTTATNTRTASPTATRVTFTATPDRAQISAVRPNVVVRGGPSQSAPILLQLEARESVDITGVSEDGQWYQIQTERGLGWVLVSPSISTAGDLQSVPVALAPSATPTPITPTTTATRTPTVTNTPTATDTHTPTFTRTPSPTATSTLTSTATATDTWTPSPTATATYTWTPTATATFTLTPMITTQPTWTSLPPPTIPARPTTVDNIAIESCPGTLPSRLIPGERGYVLEDDPRPINLRSAPSTAASIVGTVPIRSTFNVVNGPTCADDLAWYQITYDGTRGWIAEGTEVYFVVPFNEATAIPPRTSDELVQQAISDLSTCATPLVLEDFESGTASDWFVYDQSARYNIAIQNGAYQINMLSIPAQGSTDPVSWGSLQEFSFGDARIDAVIRASQFAARPSARTGIWLRYQNDENFLAFMISSAGSYRIARFQDGYTDLVPWTRTPAINIGDNAVNTLTVDVIDNTYSFFINGTLVSTVADGTWNDGRLAFMGSTTDQPATFALEHIRICQN